MEAPACARYLPGVKTQRIYLDTSVIGGCFDPEFAPWSNGLLRDFREGTFVPVVSELVAAEIAPAPDVVQGVYAELLEMGAELLMLSDQAERLAVRYLERDVIPARFEADGLHIAVATVAEVDLLVSWNFRHIVRFDRIRMFNSVNREAGYKEIEIYSPREVTRHEEDRD
jgi:hypothetical protein